MLRNKMLKVLPALTCEGVGTGLTAIGYKMAGEFIFMSFMYNAVAWLMEYVYAGATKAQTLVQPAIDAYETMCATSAKAGYMNWFRVGSQTINKACLDAGKFREQTIYNVNEALREARQYLVDLVWKANAAVAAPVVAAGAKDAVKGGNFEATAKVADAIFNSRHKIVCTIAAALEKAFNTANTKCAAKAPKSTGPGLKLKY
jgi:hypothetical protein